MKLRTTDSYVKATNEYHEIEGECIEHHPILGWLIRTELGEEFWHAPGHYEEVTGE